MADVEAAAPPQLAGLALLPERGRAARAAWAAYRFLSSASLLAVFFLLAAGWMCSVANAFRIAARWAFGAGSPWAALAEAYMDLGLYSLSLSVALVFVLVMALILHSLAVWQLLRWRERREGGTRQISRECAATIVELERERLEGTTEEDEGDNPVMGSCGPVTVIVLLVGMCAGLLILLLAPAPGSWQEWLGSVLFDGSFFLVSLMFAYVVFPSTIAAVIAEWAKVRDIAAVVTYLYVG